MRSTFAILTALAAATALGWQLVERGPEPPAAEWLPAPAPPAAALRELGEVLFFDEALSDAGNTSCASCHLPEHAFADPRRFSVGQHGEPMPRHSPALVNRPAVAFQFWDGRARSLAEQARHPLENPAEMGRSIDLTCARLERTGDYRERFARVFGSPDVRPDRLADALAAFVASLRAGPSELERLRAAGELPPRLARGEALFRGKAGCARCHAGPDFTDERFRNTGIAWKAGATDRGRAALSGLDHDVRAFKTPTLRQLVHTAPYMHDGSLPTLRDVVRHYAAGGAPDDPALDVGLEPFELDAAETADLIAFLRSLSDEVESGVDTSSATSRRD